MSLACAFSAAARSSSASRASISSSRESVWAASDMWRGKHGGASGVDVGLALQEQIRNRLFLSRLGGRGGPRPAEGVVERMSGRHGAPNIDADWEQGPSAPTGDDGTRDHAVVAVERARNGPADLPPAGGVQDYDPGLLLPGRAARRRDRRLDALERRAARE